MRSILVGLLLGLSLALAATVGTTSLPWHWGPALLVLAAALAARGVMPPLGESSIRALSPVTWLPAVLAIGWLATRAATSPVPTLASHDVALVLACAAGFWICQDLAPRAAAVRTFAGILAIVVAGQFVVAWTQRGTPDFSPIYHQKVIPGVTGFFVHYIFFANFTGAAALLLAGLALFGRGPTWWRVLLGAAAILGVGCVMLSKARGGSLALVGGSYVLLLLSLLVLKQRGHRAFPGLAIAAGVALLAGIAATPILLSRLQAARGLEASATGMLSEPARMQYFELAVGCIGQHPWFGGGSRAFSWENVKFWTTEEFGWMPNEVVFAHNELLQAASDYGILGAGLIMVAIMALLIHALAARISSIRAATPSPLAGIFVGSIAALSAMLLESFLSFAFHLLPSALLLGCCLGFAAGSTRQRHQSMGSGWVTEARAGARALAIVGSVLVGFTGYRASTALREIWPIETRGIENTGGIPERLTRAREAWPSHQFDLQRAAWHQRESIQENREADPEQLAFAISAYRDAFALYPYSAAIAINLANTLSLAGQWEEADQWFVRTTKLQGGVMAAYGTHYFYAQHLARRGRALWLDQTAPRSERRSSQALGYYQLAEQHLKAGYRHIPPVVTREEREAFHNHLLEFIKFFTNAGIQPIRPPDEIGLPEI
jgi:O-antigen ligase